MLEPLHRNACSHPSQQEPVMYSYALIALAVTLSSIPADATPPSPQADACPAAVELAASLQLAGLTAQAAKNAAITIRDDCLTSHRSVGASVPSRST
jgi:hypothetical protein